MAISFFLVSSSRSPTINLTLIFSSKQSLLPHLSFNSARFAVRVTST
uniref:Uncharacterized protein n=1 Tax=Lepeophtheirus salmonis TaxID=72036 RepID=A0A0K2VAR7_LEPSM